MIWIPQIWDEIPKPKAHIHTPLLNFFNVRRSIYLSPLPHMLVYVYAWHMINNNPSFEGGSYCFVKLWDPRGGIQKGGTLLWFLTHFASNHISLADRQFFGHENNDFLAIKHASKFLHRVLWCRIDHIVMLFIQVSELRKRFYHSATPGGLAGDRRDVVPASSFSISAQEIWKSIRENKDLNLPTHKVFNELIFWCNSGSVDQ